MPLSTSLSRPSYSAEVGQSRSPDPPSVVKAGRARPRAAWGVDHLGWHLVVHGSHDDRQPAGTGWCSRLFGSRSVGSGTYCARRDLDGRVAVVTGGCSGLGWFVAESLRDGGARVIVADLEPAEGVTVADVATADGRKAVMAAAQAEGELSILVNNAGGWSPGGAQFPDAEPAAWRHAIELNLLAPMALTQLALPCLATGGGAVVNVASSAGVETSAYGSPEYAAAKAGLIRFTTAVADWRERYGVRVNGVVPGWIGLERAIAQRTELSSAERANTPALVPPEAITAQVLRLVRDESLAGRVVTMLDGDKEPVLLH